MVGDKRAKRFIPETYKREGKLCFFCFTAELTTKPSEAQCSDKGKAEHNVHALQSKHELTRASKIARDALLVISL